MRPGITGPATLKYRLEDEQIAAFVAEVRNLNDNLGFALPEGYEKMSDQATAEIDDVDNIGPHKGEP